MTRKTEENHSFLTLFSSLLCLTDSCSNGMTALWSWDDTLCTGKEHTCFECLCLGNIYTMHITILDQLRDDHTGTMVTETTSMDVGRLEVMTQGKHRQQRSISSLITKVIFKLTTSQLRTALWFCSDKLGMLLALQVMTHEWEGKSTKVTTTTKTSNHLVRILTRHRHLLFSLQTDDSLMQSHVIQNRTQGIFTARSGCSQLNSLRNSSTQRTRMMRIASNDVLTSTCTHTRRTLNGSTKGTHDAGTVWLLLHGNLYLINGSLQSVELGSIGKGTTPLTSTCLCSNIGITLLLAVVALRNGRVDLM